MVEVLAATFGKCNPPHTRGVRAPEWGLGPRSPGSRQHRRGHWEPIWLRPLPQTSCLFWSNPAHAQSYIFFQS